MYWLFSHTGNSVRATTPRICSQDLKEAFVDMGMVAAIADWLSLLPDKSLPHLSIRTELLRVLHDLPPVSEVRSFIDTRAQWPCSAWMVVFRFRFTYNDECVQFVTWLCPKACFNDRNAVFVYDALVIFMIVRNTRPFIMRSNDLLCSVKSRN